MDRDFDTTQLVRYERQRGLSAHLRQPDIGGQSNMADEDALGVEYVPDSIVRGDASRHLFGVAGSEEPHTALIRDHQGPRVACASGIGMSVRCSS